MAGELAFFLTGRRGSDKQREADRWSRLGGPRGVRWLGESTVEKPRRMAWRAS